MLQQIQQPMQTRIDKKILIRGYRTTEEVAASLGLKKSTLIQRHYFTGDYFGLRPEKLPNGILAWPVTNETLCKPEGRKRKTAPIYKAGDRINKYTVLKYLGRTISGPNDPKPRHRYKCQCECGDLSTKNQSQLKQLEKGVVPKTTYCNCNKIKQRAQPRQSPPSQPPAAPAPVTWGYSPRAGL